MTVDVLGVGATGPSSDRSDAASAPGADASALLALLFQDLIATEDTASGGAPATDTAGELPPDASAGSTPAETSASAHSGTPPPDWSTWSAARAFLFANDLTAPPVEDADADVSLTGHDNTSSRTRSADADLPAEDAEEDDAAGDVPIDLLLTALPVQAPARDINLTLASAPDDDADAADAAPVATDAIDLDNSLDSSLGPVPGHAYAVDPASAVPAALSASAERSGELLRQPAPVPADTTIAKPASLDDVLTVSGPQTSESSGGTSDPVSLVQPIATASASRPQATLAKGVLFELRPPAVNAPPAALQQSTSAADVPQDRPSPSPVPLAVEPSLIQQAIAQAFAARPLVPAPPIVDRLSGLRAALPTAHLLELSRTSSVGAVHDEQVTDVLPVKSIDGATLLATRTNHIVTAPAVSLASDAPATGLESPALAAAVLAHEDEIASSMIQAMRMQWRNGSGSAVVNLKPDYLGDVTIALHVNGGSVDATLHAANPDVRAWLQANEAGLRQGLAAQGLTLDRFQVTEDAAERRHSQEGRRRPAPQAEPEPRRPPRRDDTQTFNVIV